MNVRVKAQFRCGVPQNIFTFGQVKILAGATLIVKGNITLRNGAQFINDGNVLVSNILKSSWTDSSVNTGSVSGTGNVLFEGTDDIRFYGRSRFYNVVVNGGALKIDFTADLQVTNQLTLKKGIVYTGDSSLLLTNNRSLALLNDINNPGYKQSYIVGSLNRSIGSNIEEYDFPVSDSSGVCVIRFLNNNIGGTTALTASFSPKSGTDAGLNVYEGAYYTSVHDAGIWHLKANAPAKAGTYGLQVFVNGFSSLTDNQFAILARLERSTNGADWLVSSGSMLPPTGSPGRTISSGFAQRNLINNFN